ncbi:methylglyoxal synthase [Synechococcus sp. PCC 7336]|uniref:methylglyoxal synthase n=1 Tax=Synechococcus sp. PCC 7336 TaxID=195250 RepID=UPI00034A1058|nr:methylglyoxal synthase [Synechococcus sp. PCC 7336]
MAATIALIAHDSKKDDMVALVQRHAPVFARYHLIATGTTGQRIRESTQLAIEIMLSGPRGGDQEIGARIASGEVTAVIFLLDPLYAKPYEPDIRAFLRICNIRNIPLATNLATAEAIATSLAQARIAHLIFNPVSGQRDEQQALELIRDRLTPYMKLQIHTTTPEVGAADLAKEAIADEPDLVIASGGDGTISEVAGALVGTQIPLGVIPRGTANAFAASLGLATAINPINNACETILKGHTRVMDTATINGRPMILLAGVGFEAEAVERADREVKNRWGVLAYLFAGWQQLKEHQLFEMELEVDGNLRQFEAGAITIANAAPPTSVLAQGSGRVTSDDGLLDITIVTAEGKLDAVRTLLEMFGAATIGSNLQSDKAIHLQAKQVVLRTDPPQKVVVDGEVVEMTPIEIECIPQSLTVVVGEQ